MRPTYRVMIDLGRARGKRVLAEGMTYGDADREARRQWNERQWPRVTATWFARIWVEPEPAPVLFSAREVAQVMVGAFEGAAR